SPLGAGLWTLPHALAFILGSQLTPLLVRRARPAFVMAAGLLLAAAGVGMFVQFDASAGLARFVVASVAFSLGTAPLFILTIDLIVGSVPAERAGAASGLAETAAEFGGALGIAIFGSLGVVVYRAAMAGAIPAGVPLAAAEAAQETLGGALAIAGQLPGPLGAQLIAAARAAFIQGLQLAAGISAAGAVGLAVFALLWLRRVGAGGATAEERPEPEGAPRRPGLAAQPAGSLEPN
ncbi:MAG: MFS transporter, partial [Candidatus Promineifilaceae bacterium]